MGAKQSTTPTPRCCIQHSRFTKQDGWRLWDISVNLSGNIAVSSKNDTTDQTSICVYTVRNSDSGDKPKIFYSKQFEKYESEGMIYRRRYVSFVDPTGDNVLLNGLGDKLEVIDLIQDRVIKSRKITVNNGSQIQCLSVRERKIFIGFYQSNKITAYNVIDLNEIKSIILQGIQDGYWPYDMTAIAGRIFVCVGDGKEETTQRSLIFEEKNGRILSELTKPTDAHWYTHSITVSVTLGVVAVVWSQTYAGTQKGKDVIVFYSLFSENNSSFLIGEMEFGIDRIRISNRGERIVTTDRVTDEVKTYDMAELFTYHHMKENLTSQLQADDCVRLINYFTLPKDQSDAILKSDTPTENLLLVLVGNGAIQSSSVDRLIEAFNEMNIISSCYHLLNFYNRTRTPTFFKDIIKKLNEEVKMARDTSDKETNQLKEELKSSKKSNTEIEQALRQTEELLQKTIQEKNEIKDEFKQWQNQHSLKTLTLEESRKMQAESEKRESSATVSSHTTAYLPESLIADEFSRLIVKVSTKLTHTHCVFLARYFNFPAAKIDVIKKERDSETLGIDVLDKLTERNIINMYDVTNLQQVLVDLELIDINETLVTPYQRQIEPRVHEEHKIIDPMQ